MKKIFLALGIFCAVIFSSCQFLEPGYWQQIIELKNKAGVKTASMPDYLNKFEWQEINTEAAELLWQSSTYRENIKTPPAKVNIYQKSDSEILVYKDTPVDKFPNWIYEKERAENIYVYAFSSMLYGEDSVILNYYIPENLPDNSKIYKASENDDYVKFEIPFSESNEDDETDEDKENVEVKIFTFIMKKGLLIQQKKYTTISVEY